MEIGGVLLYVLYVTIEELFHQSPVPVSLLSDITDLLLIDAQKKDLSTTPMKEILNFIKLLR